MLVRDIMTADPTCCSRDSNLQTVAQLMVDYDCGEIPVCDEFGKPVGVVTDRDIVCRLVAKGIDPLETEAWECMSQPVITVHPEASIEQAASLLEERQIRRLPVVDDKGSVCGMLSQADLATKAPHEQLAEVV